MLNIEDIQDMLEETELEVAYDHFPESEVPDLPFLVWFEAETENYGADNKVYQDRHDVRVEFYSKFRDIGLESDIEDLFDTYGIFWNKEIAFLDDEQCYMTIYYLEV